MFFYKINLNFDVYFCLKRHLSLSQIRLVTATYCMTCELCPPDLIFSLSFHCNLHVKINMLSCRDVTLHVLFV